VKVLFVHERFGALGGAESNACLSAVELTRRGHTVALIHGAGTGQDEAHWRGAFPQRFPLEPGRSREVVQTALEQFAPEIIYVHKMADLPLIDALVSSGCPLVRMVHDHDIYCMKSYKYAYWSRRICQRPFSYYCLLPCCAFIARDRNRFLPARYVSFSAKKEELRLNRLFHRVLVVSDYMRQELVRNGFDAGKIEILPPVPPPVRDASESAFGERNLILFAGQIIRGKGVDVLLRALSLVRSRFECLILGAGNHRRACERLMRKLGLSDRVQFKGFVPQAELRHYYSDCTVVAVSSVWPEPIATIGLEAMRHGLPVVAFDAGGIKDWLVDGYNGFLVPWMDRTRFALRIDQLLEDKPLARRLGQQGRALANQRFGFDEYIRSLEAVLSRVLTEQHGTP
jgi:glycosyltransferase involved in cell wall biosynthesis